MTGESKDRGSESVAEIGLIYGGRVKDIGQDSPLPDRVKLLMESLRQMPRAEVRG